MVRRNLGEDEQDKKRDPESQYLPHQHIGVLTARAVKDCESHCGQYDQCQDHGNIKVQSANE